MHVAHPQRVVSKIGCLRASFGMGECEIRTGNLVRSGLLSSPLPLGPRSKAPFGVPHGYTHALYCSLDRRLVHCFERGALFVALDPARLSALYRPFDFT